MDSNAENHSSKVKEPTMFNYKIDMHTLDENVITIETLKEMIADDD